MNKVCPICKLELLDDFRMIATERPYLNIGFHKTCIASVNIDEFIVENIKEILDLCLPKKGKRIGLI